MKRWSPRLARETLLGVSVIIAALGAACQPENNVKPGAPVLTTMSILEANGTKTDVTGETADCPGGAGEAGTTEGGDCDPAGPVCRLQMTYCHCVAKGEGDCSIDMSKAETQGSWVCSYGPQATVIATFDRLLDGNQLGDGTPSPDVAELVAIPAPATPVVAETDYTPNGSSTGLIFPMFVGIVGPTLAVNANPTVPTSSTVTVSLRRDKVLAKDGKTPFTATGFIQDGVITFKTNPFGASISVPVAPPPPPPDAGTDDGGVDAGVDAGAPDAASDAASDDGGTSDAGADAVVVCVPPPPPPEPDPVPPGMDPVTIAFNSAVDPTMVPAHVTVNVNGTALADTAFTVAANDAGGFNVTPKAPWPASSTITVTVDATLANVLGTQLGAPASASFTTAAM